MNIKDLLKGKWDKPKGLVDYAGHILDEKKARKIRKQRGIKPDLPTDYAGKPGLKRVKDLKEDFSPREKALALRKKFRKLVK